MLSLVSLMHSSRPAALLSGAIAAGALLGSLAGPVLGSSTTHPLPTDLDTPQVVEAFRDLDVEDLEGRSWSSETLDGKIVLVDFWATWCMPCRAEFPHLAEAYERFGDDGFEILGVSVDRVDRERVARFVATEELSWPQVHEQTGLDSPLAQRFGVAFLPRSYVFDRRGELVAVDVRGRALLELLEALVEPPVDG